MTKTLARCAVIGNPISHSLSPSIHQKFAKQTGLKLDYSKIKLERQQLSTFIEEFFSLGGIGLNVTAPFKTDVIDCVARLSKSAKVCQSANTIFKDPDGFLVGDSTDGPGILVDLKRLDFLPKVRKKSRKLNIAIIGAGGASVPVGFTLLEEGCNLYILNRTESKIANIVNRLGAYGKISSFDDLSVEQLDGIISATSEFNQALFERAFNQLKPGGFVYDLNYAKRAERLIQHCQRAGFAKVSDGYGMLLGQAAKSYEIWHGIMPSIEV